MLVSCEIGLVSGPRTSKRESERSKSVKLDSPYISKSESRPFISHAADGSKTIKLAVTKYQSLNVNGPEVLKGTVQKGR